MSIKQLTTTYKNLSYFGNYVHGRFLDLEYFPLNGCHRTCINANTLFEFTTFNWECNDLEYNI